LEQLLFSLLVCINSFELEFEMDDNNDDQALLNKVIWHYQKAITVAIT
jgi:hypothetical protein